MSAIDSIKSFAMGSRETLGKRQSIAQHNLLAKTSQIDEARVRMGIRPTITVTETCWACAKPATPKMRCAECPEACYCSRVCQKKDWTDWHKNECSTLKENAARWPAVKRGDPYKLATENDMLQLQLIPKAEHVQLSPVAMEPMIFSDLFPRTAWMATSGTGGSYAGRGSFESYVRRQLRDPRFGENLGWLQFAMARTADRGTIDDINAVMFDKHGIIGRHKGKSDLELIQVGKEEFLRLMMSSDGTRLIYGDWLLDTVKPWHLWLTILSVFSVGASIWWVGGISDTSFLVFAFSLLWLVRWWYFVSNIAFFVFVGGVLGALRWWHH